MRLLKLQGDRISITKFDKNPPKYAILSHTWDAAEDEVLYGDLAQEEEEAKNKRGYEKIEFCAKQTASHNLEYFWIDTCCIDKADVQEFQSAINSMFRWYQNAEICFVYLNDVPMTINNQTCQEQAWKENFRSSRWFTRSWTLQELIAPQKLEFYSSEHQLLGNKKSLEKEIFSITSIPISALRGLNLSHFTTEKRILWAKDRESTFEEDQAYALLGLCGVPMVPNYGEGVKAAFERLRKKCNKVPIKGETAFIAVNDGKRDRSYASRNHEISSPPCIENFAPFELARTNNIQKGKRGPLNRPWRQLANQFKSILTARKKPEDAMGPWSFPPIDYEDQQDRRKSFLRSSIQSKNRDHPVLYSSTEDLTNQSYTGQPNPRLEYMHRRANLNNNKLRNTSEEYRSGTGIPSQVDENFIVDRSHCKSTPYRSVTGPWHFGQTTYFTLK